MLINGFFFNQGFAIRLFPSMGRAFGWRSTSAPERHDAPRILQRIMNRQRCHSFREDVARRSFPRRLLPVYHIARQSAVAHDRATRKPMLQCTTEGGA